MDFERYTVVLLALRDDAPELDDADADALQNAHMAHLADLHESGALVAAGPLTHDRYRGLSILRVDADEAHRLKRADPAVVAGRFDIIVMPWMLPAGAVTFTPTHFPRSIDDV